MEMKDFFIENKNESAFLASSNLEYLFLFIFQYFKTRNTDLRHRADIDRVETMLQRRRLRWLGHVQRMENSSLPKKLLVIKIEGGKRLQKRQKQRWHEVMNADLKSLGMVSTWRLKALARNDWRNNIHSKLFELNQVKEINEKGQKRSQKKTKKQKQT